MDYMLVLMLANANVDDVDIDVNVHVVMDATAWWNGTEDDSWVVRTT